MAVIERHRVLNGLRIVLALLVTVAVAVAVARNWSQVSADLRKVDGGSLALAALCVALARCSPCWAGGGSSPTSGRRCTSRRPEVFFVGQLGKYLPGTVWSIVAQAEMGARLHIPRRRSAVVGLITMGTAAICGLAVGLPALPLLLQREDGRGAAWGLVLALPLLAVMLWPPLLNWGIARGLRLLGREPLEHSLSGRAVLVTAGYFVAAWVASGLHAFVLVSAIGSPTVDSGQAVLASVCGFALASSLAMLTVVLPAVGVQEDCSCLLTPATSVSAATAVVVLSRFLLLADVVFALAGWAWARSHHLLTSRAERAKEGVVLEEDEAGDTSAV